MWKSRSRRARTPNSRPGRDIHYNRNGRFHTREGLFVWDGLSVWWFASNRWYVSSVNTAVSVLNECRAPALSWTFACSLLLFHKIIFYLTIDISMCKIILEVKYFIKSMIHQMLKFFKRTVCFIPRWSEDLYFDLKIEKIQVN